jgi:hypothetical protein
MQGEMPARLQFFKQSFELKIKGDLIPEDAAEEIIGGLQALFARHNAGAALECENRHAAGGLLDDLAAHNGTVLVADKFSDLGRLATGESFWRGVLFHIFRFN